MNGGNVDNLGPPVTMNTREAAAYCGATETTFRKWCQEGNGPRRKLVQGRYVFRQDDLDRFLMGMGEPDPESVWKQGLEFFQVHLPKLKGTDKVDAKLLDVALRWITSTPAKLPDSAKGELEAVMAEVKGLKEAG